MLKTKQRLIILGLNIFTGLIFILVSFFLKGQTFLFSFVTSSIVLATLLIIQTAILQNVLLVLERKVFYTGSTSILTRFIDRFKFCYTLDDFIRAATELCEEQGDISLIYADREANHLLYNSSFRITESPATIEKLKLNFPATWEDGYYFFDEKLGLLSNSVNARGFFLVSEKYHLYFLCRYTHLFDTAVYPKLLKEFERFKVRSRIIASMSEISSLSKEWALLADTQKSFLPKTLPEVRGLDIAAYYRPLVNVSGDYYTVLKVDEDKTLVMLGDVSGKGLAAALVMGIVMNTVKIRQNKEDLPATIRAIDKAIKGMNLQDKYTVLFIGLIDTKKMAINYINASMADPVIISRSAEGGRLRALESNASLIGIVELDEVISPGEQKLYTGDMLLMASDGVSEVMNNEGTELGNTEQYKRTLKNSSVKSAKHFVNDIANLVMDYSAGGHLRDDVTMLAVKIGGML